MDRPFAIRRLRHEDRPHWDRLWQGYLTFYEADVPDAVSDLTWSRLMDPEGPIEAFCAEWANGALMGVVHYLFHPVTWAAGPRCYLEDLFTATEARGQGVGRALIEAVYEAADARGADQVYWLTAHTNATARKLYDSVASLTPFVKYRR
jgi:ribosomal protein S18 acetylase RimI-like enzyme